MKNLFILPSFSFFVVVFLMACTPDKNTPNIYDSCCGTEPVEFTVQGTNAHVYVPNIFTPNHDGINDAFLPLSNGQIMTINYMVISKIESDLSTTLLYQVQNVDAQDVYDYAWDGNDLDGIKHKGAFDYQISFYTTDSLAFIVEGKGCSMVCDGETPTDIPRDGCFYPTQSDNGRLNILIPNGEYEYCF